MARPRLLLVVALALVVAGCVRDAPAALAPSEDAPSTASPESAPASPSPSSSGAPAPTSTRPPPASQASSTPSSAPGDWPAGPGTMLRDAVERSIASGQPVTLQAHPVAEFAGVDVGLDDPVERSVVLRPSRLLSAQPWAQVDGAPTSFPQVAAYEGEVEGEPANLVRLTITPQWARGSIREGDDTLLVRQDTDGNLPPRAAKASSWNGAVPPARFDPLTWTDAEDCLRAAPPYVTPMTDVGRAEVPALDARIVLDIDAEGAERIGPDAFAWMIAVAHEMDSIYDHEVGIRFVLVGVHQHTQKGTFPVPEQSGDDPLEKLAQTWNARTDVDRDLVHLFTGHPSDFARANCIGGAGMAEIAYSFTPIQWETDYVTFHTQAFAHELGHLFSAHHHYGNHAEARLATIMIQGYTPGIQPVFGTLEKSVIRGWAEEKL